MSNTVIDPDAAGAPSVTLFPPPSARQRWAPGDLIRLLIGWAFVLVGLFAASFAEGTISGVENDVVDAIGRIRDAFPPKGMFRDKEWRLFEEEELAPGQVILLGN